MRKAISFFVLIAAFLFRAVYAGDGPADGNRIIEKAKEAAKQNRLKAYKLKSYTKSFLNIFDPDKNAYEADAVTLVHSDVYWKGPDHRREIETAYRHIHKPKFFEYDNINFETIDDFSRSSIPVNNTSVVGPLSIGSEKYYLFHLLDSASFNGIPAYRVQIVPKTGHQPLMEGVLTIAADTYRLMAADIAFNKGIKLFPQPHTFTLRQTFSLKDGKYWIPDETHWDLQFDFSLLGRHIKAEWYSISKVYDYEINPVIDRKIFSNRLIEQASDARYKDTTFWNSNQIVPMTTKEEEGFWQLASLQKNKKILYPDLESFELKQRKENIRWGFKILPDFRYNRVEGSFAGGEIQLNNLALKHYVRDLSLKGKFGYGFMDNRYKYSGEFRQALASRIVTVGARYYNDIAYRELTGNVLTNSLSALAYRYDAFNYYYVKGYETFVQVNPRHDFKIEFNYTARADSSAQRNAQYALVNWLYKKFDPVYPVNTGRLRRLSAAATYMFGHGAGIVSREVYWILEGTVEYSDRRLLKSDFNYTKYYVTARFHYPTTRRGSLDGKLFGGYGTHELPQQYLFDLYGGSSPYALKTVDLREAEGNHFQGNYMAALAVEHNFGGELLEYTGLPYLKDGHIDLIPTIGVGYVELSPKTLQQLAYQNIQDLRRPIYEAGFALGDIHRFARVDFSWRLNQRKAGTRNFGVILSVLLQNY